ncbi:MAG: glycosyltransferase family 87 protein [Algoriphagus sp.]
MAGLLFVLAQTPRFEFGLTFGLFGLIFSGMVLLFFLSEHRINRTKIFWAGILLRLAVFAFAPQWSDDVYRFLWDGELLTVRENPYLQTPREYQEAQPDSDNSYLNSLFDKLNSPDYYSVYPPLNQAVFTIGAVASNGSIWNGFFALRLMLILGEIAVFYLLWKLLELFQKPSKIILLYWFNPLIILEITGNLHFEGLVLVFLLASLLALQKRKNWLSGGFWGLAISMKLLPLMLVPAFLFFAEARKNLTFWIASFFSVILCFVWLYWDDSYLNFFQSIRLYQGKFEFNGSVYYLLREVGFWIKGYNTIETLTKILSGATLLAIVFFSWKMKPKSLFELVDLLVLIYLIYLILQPVVHPWYIIPAFGLSLLTHRNTFLIWTFAVIFSYQAYGNTDFKESPIFLFTEYFLVFAAIFFDYFRPYRIPNFKS